MKKLNFKGNLPGPIAAFAVKLGGTFSKVKDTEFWEAFNIKEFEKNASEIGYEIIPTIDGVTKRGYLVGFDAEDSVIVGTDGDSYSRLKMYFVEVTSKELKLWDKKIRRHRKAQENDMRIRQEINKENHDKAKQRLVKLVKKTDQEKVMSKLTQMDEDQGLI